MRRSRRHVREWGYGRFPPYVPVAERRAQTDAITKTLRKSGEKLEPVTLTTKGNAIAKTFWGKAWCQNVERYSDYANRLPRGRTYVRSGSVIDLRIAAGKVTARVSGSELYSVVIAVAKIATPRWREIVKASAGKIDSLIELLKGKLPESVLDLVTHPKRGLFPELEQIELSCSCPDGASMCKHVAAALYGVGARLDERPELLFLLRGVDHEALITAASVGGAAKAKRGARTKKDPRVLDASSLGDVFGIELEAPTRGQPRA